MNTIRERLTAAASELWAAYGEAAHLNHFSSVLAVRSQLDTIMSMLENIDDVASSDG